MHAECGIVRILWAGTGIHFGVAAFHCNNMQVLHMLCASGWSCCTARSCLVAALAVAHCAIVVAWH
jgi:hypothetical protein